MIEYIRIALEGIKLNKMRSFLTMLGIIIGISSVITIQTLGNGLKKSVSTGLSTFGTNQMYVYTQMREGYSASDRRAEDFFTLDDLERLTETVPNIEAVSVSEGAGTFSVREGRNKAKVSINYCKPGNEKIDNLKIIAGKFFDENADKSGKSVCVVSEKFLDKLKISPEEALGKEIQCESSNKQLYSYQIVGVYRTAEINSPLIYMDENPATILYIPFSTGLKQFSYISPEYYYTSGFSLKGKDGADHQKLKNDLIKYCEKNGYGEDDRLSVGVESLEEEMNEVDNIMKNITFAIGAIAFISLIVGGIGVMNILLVSVTERTREIGIRKALGATNKDIRMQFIVESIILCAIGGIIGIVLGAVVGYITSSAIGTPNLPDAQTIAVAVGFSMIIGIFFGYYPANRAAKLDPIDALRYE